MKNWELMFCLISGVSLGIEFADRETINERPYEWGVVVDLLIFRLILKVA